MSGIQRKEIELKYRADGLSLAHFEQVCKERGPSTHIQASGHDHFYEGTSGDRFARHRTGPDYNQLTFKRKTTEKNNFIRTEHNIMLGQKVDRAQINDLMNEFGYAYNTSIYKNVFIYDFGQYNLVYYVVYDTDLHEVGRFIEIEMSESHPWPSEADAWKSLTDLERELRGLGCSAQARVKKSLYEMVKK